MPPGFPGSASAARAAGEASALEIRLDQHEPARKTRLDQVSLCELCGPRLRPERILRDEAPTAVDDLLREPSALTWGDRLEPVRKDGNGPTPCSSVARCAAVSHPRSARRCRSGATTWARCSRRR